MQAECSDWVTSEFHPHLLCREQWTIDCRNSELHLFDWVPALYDACLISELYALMLHNP